MMKHKTKIILGLLILMIGTSIYARIMGLSLVGEHVYCSVRLYPSNVGRTINFCRKNVGYYITDLRNTNLPQTLKCMYTPVKRGTLHAYVTAVYFEIGPNKQKYIRITDQSKAYFAINNYKNRPLVKGINYAITKDTLLYLVLKKI